MSLWHCATHSPPALPDAAPIRRWRCGRPPRNLRAGARSFVPAGCRVPAPVVLPQPLALSNGRLSEPKALYVARAGEVYDRITGAKIRDHAGRQIGRRARNALPPKIAAKAIEIREAAVLATDWADFHAKMVALKAAYRKKGSGAVVAVADQEVKASAIHPSCSRTHLEAALGVFAPDPSDRTQGYEAYREAYRLRLDHIRTVHTDERARLKTWLDETLSGLEANVGTALPMAVRAEYRAALQSLDSAFRDAKITFAAARLSPDQWTICGLPRAPAIFPLPTLMMPPARVGAARKRVVPRPHSGIESAVQGIANIPGAHAPTPKRSVSHVEDEIPAAVRDAWLAGRRGPSR